MTETPASRRTGGACGVFGVALKDEPGRSAAHCAYTALFALQHRGQQTAGIATVESGEFHLHKGPGLVSDVFTEKHLSALPGAAAIGSVSYAQRGFSAPQPLAVQHASGAMALSYNGNLTNALSLRQEMEAAGGIFQTGDSAEVLAHLLVRERLRAGTIEEAVQRAMAAMQGAYSALLLTQGKLVAFRDPGGVHPLCMGRIGDSIAFASESCAFPVLGGEYLREVAPGEIVTVDLGSGLWRSIPGPAGESRFCIFELLYFARSDSVLEGAAVDCFRMEAGRLLARKNAVDADCVVGVPDSGITPAMGFARESGLPLRSGFVKNRYIGRTLIQPTESEREKALKIKLSALRSSVRGQRVVVVDDSILRGGTCRRTVALIREAGAREVHFRVASPPFQFPCPFGSDLPDQSELLTPGRTPEEIRAYLGADSLEYLTLPELRTLSGTLRPVCDICFSGNPIPSPKEIQT